MNSVSLPAATGSGRQPLALVADPSSVAGLPTKSTAGRKQRRTTAQRSLASQNGQKRPLDAAKRARLTELGREFAAAHAEFGMLLVTTAARGLGVGRLALEAKRIAGHGHFGAWKKSLCDEYGISDRTIERYLYLAKHRRQLLATLGIQSSEADEFSNDSFDQVFTGLKLQEAIALLKSSNGSKTTAQSAQVPSRSQPQSGAIPSEVLAIAHEFFGHVDLLIGATNLDTTEAEIPQRSPEDAVTAAATWEGQVLVHATTKSLSPLVARLQEEYEHGHLTAALLFAPAITDNRELLTLQAYPRAFFRTRLVFPMETGGNTVADMPYLLLLLDREERTREFALAVGGHADLYVPLDA